MVMSATLLAGIWCLCLWTSGILYSALLAFSILRGTTVGIRSSQMVGPMLADAFGMKLLPSALSIVWTVSAIPSACRSSNLNTYQA
ncbi:hypothetical protein J3F83DRAFT_738608 [Trichoderma novae-zelandiae]